MKPYQHDESPLNKNIVIICSAGRTGTTFFGRTLPSMIDKAACVHEPDMWAGISAKSWQRIRTFGLYHMVLGRMMGHTGMRNLSQAYLLGRLSPDRLAREVVRQRNSYYRSFRQDLIIESAAQWYGALSALPHTGWRYRVVALVRDPRTWVASAVNHGRLYGHRDRVRRLGFRRLDPDLIGDEQFASKWSDMSNFQKICWTWSATYRVLLKSVEEDPKAKIYRFEDLFLGDDRLDYMENMLRFITNFDDQAYEWRLPPDALDLRVHEADRTRLADWPDWTLEQTRQLDEICGPLMRQFKLRHRARMAHQVARRSAAEHRSNAYSIETTRCLLSTRRRIHRSGKSVARKPTTEASKDQRTGSLQKFLRLQPLES